MLKNGVQVVMGGTDGDGRGGAADVGMPTRGKAFGPVKLVRDKLTYKTRITIFSSPVSFQMIVIWNIRMI